MPLDHYVPQVHLKNFSAADLDGDLMHAIRKADLKAFPCRPKDVCRIENGSSNEYLLHDRVIELFLKEIEPRYNEAIATLRQGKIDHKSAFVVAGFNVFSYRDAARDRSAEGELGGHSAHPGEAGTIRSAPAGTGRCQFHGSYQQGQTSLRC